MKTMVTLIRNTAGVRCREVVRFSEGPLWEVRLYVYNWLLRKVIFRKSCKKLSCELALQ